MWSLRLSRLRLLMVVIILISSITTLTIIPDSMSTPTTPPLFVCLCGVRYFSTPRSTAATSLLPCLKSSMTACTALPSTPAELSTRSTHGRTHLLHFDCSDPGDPKKPEKNLQIAPKKKPKNPPKKSSALFFLFLLKKKKTSFLLTTAMVTWHGHMWAQNIVLSGGSTLFKDFGRRLQRDIKKLVDVRVGGASATSLESLEARTKVRPLTSPDLRTDRGQGCERIRIRFAV